MVEGGLSENCFHRRPGRIAFYFGNDFWHFVTPHGVKITTWMIKYPLIKKNAACENTQHDPGSQHTQKVTCIPCTSFLENLHSGNIHTMPRLTKPIAVLQYAHVHSQTKTQEKHHRMAAIAVSLGSAFQLSHSSRVAVLDSGRGVHGMAGLALLAAAADLCAGHM